MKRCYYVLAMLGLFLAGSGLCSGQEVGATSVQINTDTRTRLPFAGQSRTGLYNAAVQVKSRLTPSLRFLYDGAQSNAPIVTGAGGRFNKFITQEAALEGEWGTQRLQAGIIRLPFGLYNTEETYASGLIDYPLARVDYALNSLYWGAPGIRWSGGPASLQAEAALFGGQAAGVWGNQNNVQGAALRLQTFARDVVLGVSRWDGTESASINAPGRQRTHMNGLDVRYTRPHLMLRGEYLFGVLGNEQMHGWYLDAYYHLPKFFRWTLVARLEEYQATSNVSPVRQVTLGFRYTLDSHWIFAVNWRKNNGPPYPGWTPATHDGDIFFQVYHKLYL